jgi:signal transduction histidine kinase
VLRLFAGTAALAIDQASLLQRGPGAHSGRRGVARRRRRFRDRRRAGAGAESNAPLTALMTLAQMIQSDPAADGTSRDRSAQIIQAAQRAQRLVRELLTMTKPRPPTFEAVDLNVLIK